MTLKLIHDFPQPSTPRDLEAGDVFSFIESSEPRRRYMRTDAGLSSRWAVICLISAIDLPGGLWSIPNPDAAITIYGPISG